MKRYLLLKFTFQSENYNQMYFLNYNLESGLLSGTRMLFKKEQCWYWLKVEKSCKMKGDDWVAFSPPLFLYDMLSIRKLPIAELPSEALPCTDHQVHPTARIWKQRQSVHAGWCCACRERCQWVGTPVKTRRRHR